MFTLVATVVVTPGMLAALLTSFASTAGVTIRFFLPAPTALSILTTVFVLYSSIARLSMTIMSPAAALALSALRMARRLTLRFKR
ncbi:membrane protein [gut metagenome]|uniref:Membrane protein n=1 Tax=gut metagenome TaxID=749906 RepID=J9GUI0_9ZZZZ